MGKHPRVSVVVTTYNQAPFIASALESVFAQTRPADEVIVVDDGSTDETPQRMALYRDRIVSLRQPNQGVARSRNAGIQRAGGELLAFLDGDDLWDAEKLARQIAAASAHPDAGLIAVDGVQFTDAGIMRQSLFPAQIARLFADGVESMSVDVSRHLLQENVIWTTSQVMIPARVLKTAGLSDPEFRLVNDWDLYLRIAEHYPATFLRHRLTRWRYHETSASGQARLRELRWGEDSIRMLAKHIRRTGGDRRRAVRAALRSQVFMTAEAAYDHTKPGQRELGLGCLWRLLRWSLVSVAPAMFLLAAYSPAWLTRSLGRMARAVLRVRRSA